MKKLLFLLCASQLSFAQQSVFSQPQKDQLNSFNSPSLNDTTQKGIFIADDFELTNAVKIEKVKVFAKTDAGFLDAGNLISWNILIFQDQSGKPSAIPGKNETGLVYKFSKLASQGGVTVTQAGNDATNISVEFDTTDNSFVFQPNTKYWISVFPTVKSEENFFSEKFFYWAASTTTTPKLEQAKMVDPDDIMMNSYTTWTDLKGPSMGITGMAFELYGKDALGINDITKSAIKVYPNPTSKTLSINAKNVKSTEVYSLDGKLVLTSTKSEVNVETLAKGTYTLVVTFDNGQKSTEKFIKN